MSADGSELTQRIESFIADADDLNAAQAEERLLPILIDLMALQGFNIQSAIRPETLATDFVGVATPGGRQEGRVGIEYKHYSSRRLVGSQEIRQVVGLARAANLDRVLLIAKSGFTRDAVALVANAHPVAVQLLEYEDLRRLAPTLPSDTDAGEQIRALIRALSEEAARVVARDPRALDHLEWRDVERMMTAVLAGLGFDAELTPASKDGGKDIILRLQSAQGHARSYIVELKHWRSGKTVGVDPIKDFVRVVARERHDSGLFLSSSGYTSDAHSSLTEVERSRVRLGGETKVVSLCRSFVQAGNQLWRPAQQGDLPELLFSDTI